MEKDEPRQVTAVPLLLSPPMQELVRESLNSLGGIAEVIAVADKLFQTDLQGLRDISTIVLPDGTLPTPELDNKAKAMCFSALQNLFLVRGLQGLAMVTAIPAMKMVEKSPIIQP